MSLFVILGLRSPENSIVDYEPKYCCAKLLGRKCPLRKRFFRNTKTNGQKDVKDTTYGESRHDLAGQIVTNVFENEVEGAEKNSDYKFIELSMYFLHKQQNVDGYDNSTSMSERKENSSAAYPPKIVNSYNSMEKEEAIHIEEHIDNLPELQVLEEDIDDLPEPCKSIESKDNINSGDHPVEQVVIQKTEGRGDEGLQEIEAGELESTVYCCFDEQTRNTHTIVTHESERIVGRANQHG